MIITNKGRTVFYKRLFYLVSLVIAIIALILFLMDLTIYALASVGVFALWFLFFQVIDYQYIEFSDENNKILLRYYKLIRFGKTEFNAIEFPQRILYNVSFENSVFGKMTDLTFIIKTRRGIAEYPSVSLTALPKEDRVRMKAILYNILGI
jgi:hypothetical protein